MIIWLICVYLVTENVMPAVIAVTERRIMMQNNDFNKIIITGFANSAPVLNNTANGTPVVNFELRSSMKRRSDVFDITVWGDLAMVAASSIFPDDKILIEGHILHRRFNDETVKANESVEVVAKRIYSLAGRDKISEFSQIFEY